MSVYEDALIEKVRRRAKIGKKKYGVTVERTDLSLLNWMQHAQEEALDFAIYLERAMSIVEKMK